jgi:hypothetical protein
MACPDCKKETSTIEKHEVCYSCKKVVCPDKGRVDLEDETEYICTGCGLVLGTIFV